MNTIVILNNKLQYRMNHEVGTCTKVSTTYASSTTYGRIEVKFDLSRSGISLHSS